MFCFTMEQGEGIKLALHVAIIAGPLEMMHVGGGMGSGDGGKAMQALGPTADTTPPPIIWYLHCCVVVV
jgi:hypothetical protein